MEPRHTSPCALLLLVATAAALLLLSASSPLRAAEEAFFSFSPSSEDPWHLTADRLVLRQQENILQAYGNVVLRQGEKRLQADNATYHWEKKTFRASGRVRIMMDKNSARAREASFDFTNETGWLRDGQIFLHDPHIYASGSELRKTGPRTFTFDRATITSCDGETPDWSLRTKQGSLTVDGYARLWHPRFRIRDYPLLYSPFMVLPAKQTRQSGFLFPQISTSTQDGTTVNIPYYQVLDQERDLTLSAQAMSKRGAKLGAEYRFTPDLQSKGLFRADWLMDQKEEEDVEEFEDYERPSDHRYWLRGKYNGYLLDPAWRSKLDLDFASDKFYLREFDYGTQGFDNSREVLLEEFGRDIADRDDPVRENIFILSRNWASAGLQVRTEYNQNLDYFNIDPDESPTLHRLPQIDFNIYRTSLLNTLLDWEVATETTHFWRRKDDEPTGTRMDLHPRISLPLQSPYGTLTPSAGWRETIYHTMDAGTSDPQRDPIERRGIWDFSTTATSELYRIVHLNPVKGLEATPENRGTVQWSKIKHTLRPEVDYDFIPERDQSRLPEYDSVDRIEARNEVTYSLSNLFALRRDRIVATSSGNATRYERTKDYRDLLSLKLEQSYDIREADRTRNLDTDPRRPFTDIKLEAEVTPFPFVTLTDTTWYSPYVEDITEHEHRLSLSHGPLSAFFAYDYLREMERDIHRSDQEELSILKAGGSLNPDAGWQMSFSTERDLQTSKLIERNAFLGYRHQCWVLGLNYTREPDETRFSLTIGLRPFGQVEQGIAAMEE